jgi:CheY-like chemotaxis protein
MCRDAVARILNADDVDCDFASDGQEAFQLASRKDGWIVTDIHMPNIGGFELCSALRSVETSTSTPFLQPAPINASTWKS